tara:strand:- start:146 stop:688 length:543 start_codon:yes stop_codon:yes gene_type:complete
MTKIILAPLILFMGLPVQAEISIQKVKAAQQKVFVLCQLEHGLDKEKLEFQANYVLEANELPTRLMKDKEVLDRAQSLFEEAGCDAFPKGVYLFDWVSSVEKNTEEIFNNASKEEQIIMKKFAYATCKFNNKDFSLLERDSYAEKALEDSSIDLSSVDINRIVEGGYSYLNKLDKKTCSI